MYLPRENIDLLYDQFWVRYNTQSDPVLVLVALEPDALCACHILIALFRNDNILYKIRPISGYDELKRVGETMVWPMKKHNGGEGGLVVCLGVGGMVDMSTVLGLDEIIEGTDPADGVEVWLMDARRPWNLGNVFGGDPNDMLESGIPDDTEISSEPQKDKGRILPGYKAGQGGIIVYDDGDVEQQMIAERDAYWAIVEMPHFEEDGYLSGDSDLEEDENVLDSVEIDLPNERKRKASMNGTDDASDVGDQRARQRRRTNSDGSQSLYAGDPPNGIEEPTGSQYSSRANSPSVQVPSSAPQTLLPQRALIRRLTRERRKYHRVISKYYGTGSSYSEPISSMMYSLAEAKGRENKDMLWQAIVGVSSLELHGRSMAGVGISTSLDAGGSAGWGGERGERIRSLLRDEVNRLCPPDLSDQNKDQLRGEASGVIPTTAKSPLDDSIRLSPEPRFLLIRHWSLYESMLHSPYLGAKLHIWNDQGRKRLHKLLAKMGVSLSQCKQSYTHMDMDLKRGLRQRLLTYAPVYGLDGLVPPKDREKKGWGFVKCWGWKGCFSAIDVGVIVGAILEIGKHSLESSNSTNGSDHRNNLRNRADRAEISDQSGALESEEWVSRFWQAYDALEDVDALKHALPSAQHLHRAILRTGTSVIEKRQIRHLKAFRMAVVKEGPDVALFTHPGALTKLALWVAEAIAEQEKDHRGQAGNHGRPTPLVMATLNEARGVYVVVGTNSGGGVVDFVARAKRRVKLQEKTRRRLIRKEERDRQRRERKAERQRASDAGSDEEEESEEEDDEDDEIDDESDDDDLEFAEFGVNRFGLAFQEVVDETSTRVRIDSFENSVVEVKKEDLSGFLERLSMKVVVG
ncbi:uncharacterized protein KY384_007075 [Bacidia gigantensis]|uniref:uncharacterized protein n=1 Tax=Bacidia gigantensis TaxID=2732470 RepID=UPI001D04DBF1|nr:uncharacterized protein KY384_007075 [Bacidia gigantensis]KAG8528159.1 hypothetical protein KY384_007075 [Bacidia gigantensis]